VRTSRDYLDEEAATIGKSRQVSSGFLDPIGLQGSNPMTRDLAHLLRIGWLRHLQPRRRLETTYVVIRASGHCAAWIRASPREMTRNHRSLHAGVNFAHPPKTLDSQTMRQTRNLVFTSCGRAGLPIRTAIGRRVR
jgi:hypothetical protein